jgi:hypothetical protein
MVPLRNVDQQIPAGFQHANIFAQQRIRLRVAKVFQEPLMKNNVEGRIPKRQSKCVSADD